MVRSRKLVVELSRALQRTDSDKRHETRTRGLIPSPSPGHISLSSPHAKVKIMIRWSPRLADSPNSRLAQSTCRALCNSNRVARVAQDKIG